MRLPTSSRGPIGFNMTPMIDVVFLLIIFFLLSSHMARQESQLPLNLPAARTGRSDEDDQTVRRLVVNVLPASQSGRSILIGGRRVNSAELSDVIQRESLRSSSAKDKRPLEVRIRCDRTVPYRHIEPILLACAAAGVWDVTFAVVASD